METDSQTFSIQKNILDEIKKAEKIIIHRHIHPDPDALGSQCGLAEIIKESFPEKSVKTAGEDSPRLSFLVTMDPPEDEEYENALVIVVDTANEPRISDPRFNKGKTIIKIDHHPKDDEYASIEWNNTKASSCSEMITDFWLAFPNELKMNDKAARLLYGGIVGDTNRFLYDATTPHTMRVAAQLMTYDFSSTDLNNELNSTPPNVAKLKGHVLESTEVDEETGFAQVMLTQEKIKEYGVRENEDTSAVVSLPSQIEGSLLWAIFVEQREGGYRVHLRSKGPFINEIAKAHGGGGHPLASGTNAKDQTEIESIVSEMKKAGKEWKITHKEK